MKRFVALVALLAVIASLLCACGAKCNYCGDAIKGDAVKANGRKYCSYEHYLQDFWLN